MTHLMAAEQALPEVDKAIVSAISAKSQQDADFWTFRTGAKRAYSSRYFQYPAMMVPQMQRELLHIVGDCQPGVSFILDPFVGSGTMIAEAMLGGFSVLGQDVNPLAILLSKVRVGPFPDPEYVQQVAQEVIATAREDKRSNIETSLPSAAKWFTEKAIQDLSRLRRAIRRQSDSWIRRFMWVTLAETIRQCSKSRPSTFKLHKRTEEDVARLSEPLVTFAEVVQQNISSFRGYFAQLTAVKRLDRGRYTQFADAYLQDSSATVGRPNHSNFQGQFDLLITSPPYGDNLTTVTYGQYSYLPLWWIDQEDVGERVDLAWHLRTTQQIDRSGLGGSITTDRGVEEQATIEASPALRHILRLMPVDKPDRSARILSFSRDLRRCLSPILSSLKPNAYMIWTVGNRTVGGHEVPTDTILTELLAEQGAVVVCDVARAILGKRIADRNSVAPTMSSERVIVARKRRS